MNSPIAIFAYNRPERLRELLGSLALCPEFHASDVTIYIDGPRDKADKVNVDDVTRIAQTYPHNRMQVVKSTRNKGLRTSIVRGISEQLERHDRVIILEEDLAVSPDFLKYMNAALKKYANETNVWSICADIPKNFGGRKASAHFMPYANPHGWGTWKRVWSRFEAQCDPQLRTSRTFKERLNVHGLRNFVSMLDLNQSGKVDSWFVYWQISLVRHNAVSLFPPVPLVVNNGLNAGTHSSAWNLFSLFPLDKEVGSFSFDLPDDVIVSFEGLDSVISSREARLFRANAFLGRIKRMLGTGVLK